LIIEVVRRLLDSTRLPCVYLKGFLSPGELDPLNRRLTAEPKPDIVVQSKLLCYIANVDWCLLIVDSSDMLNVK
jgi:hypothetical protein